MAIIGAFTSPGAPAAIVPPSDAGQGHPLALDRHRTQASSIHRASALPAVADPQARTIEGFTAIERKGPLVGRLTLTLAGASGLQQRIPRLPAWSEVISTRARCWELWMARTGGTV